jgi:S1-C subfamily serine protease
MEGNIILTSAHVVAGQSHIEVRKFGAAQKYEAHVLSLSYESDLALLRVDDDSFFGGVSVLRMGKVPGNCEIVKILGFPGGENLIITNGTFAEINHQYYQFSGSYLPAGEIRAIIRPGNSGGPVVIDDKVVGIVMQISRNDDICHMIPVNIIHQFIEDSKVSYHSWPDIPFL